MLILITQALAKGDKKTYREYRDGQNCDTSQLQRIWKVHNLSRKTKIKLVKSLVFSIFSYGSEAWTLKKAYRDRIDAFEMWCWRKMLQIPWTAFRSNDSISRKRPKGRSQLRWSDQIRSSLDTKLHNAFHSAEDRNRWRSIVKLKVTSRRGNHDPQQ